MKKQNLESLLLCMNLKCRYVRYFFRVKCQISFLIVKLAQCENGDTVVEIGVGSECSNTASVRNECLIESDTDESSTSCISLVLSDQEDGQESDTKEQDPTEDEDNITTVFDQFAPQFSTLSLEAKSSIILETKKSNYSAEELLHKSKIECKLKATKSVLDGLLNDDEERLMMLELNTFSGELERIQLEDEEESNFNENAKYNDKLSTSTAPKKKVHSYSAVQWQPGFSTSQEINPRMKAARARRRAELDEETTNLVGAEDLRKLSDIVEAERETDDSPNECNKDLDELLESPDTYMPRAVESVDFVPAPPKESKPDPSKRRNPKPSLMCKKQSKANSLSSTRTAGYYPGVLAKATITEDKNEVVSCIQNEATETIEKLTAKALDNIENYTYPDWQSATRINCRDIKTEVNTTKNKKRSSHDSSEATEGEVGLNSPW